MLATGLQDIVSDPLCRLFNSAAGDIDRMELRNFSIDLGTVFQLFHQRGLGRVIRDTGAAHAAHSFFPELAEPGQIDIQADFFPRRL